MLVLILLIPVHFLSLYSIYFRNTLFYLFMVLIIVYYYYYYYCQVCSELKEICHIFFEPLTKTEQSNKGQ